MIEVKIKNDGKQEFLMDDSHNWSETQGDISDSPHPSCKRLLLLLYSKAGFVLITVPLMKFVAIKHWPEGKNTLKP